MNWQVTRRRDYTRWLMVDPAGNATRLVGMNHVDHDGRWPFKYPSTAAWRDDTVSLLKGAGFNCAGAWSTKALGEFPRCHEISFLGAYAKSKGVKPKTLKQLKLVMDDGFEAFCIKHAKEECDPADPAIVGYFLDNELAWDQLSNLKKVAERYFAVTTAAVRAADPGRLILGARFHRPAFGKKVLFEIAGKYCDIISINYYGVDKPVRSQTANWFKWSGRPYLVTEFYAMADKGILDLSAGQHFTNDHGAGKHVLKQAARAKFYRIFVAGCVADPNCVGWHWFRYPDVPVAEDGGANKGVVGVKFSVYVDLLEQMRTSNLAGLGLDA